MAAAAEDTRPVTYANPLVARYATKEMSYLFSPQHRHSTWRRFWLALAESEQELGLDVVTDEALEQMRAHLDDIDFEMAAEEERRMRHDVMAHVHTFGHVAPAAMPILHLGATSAAVTDAADAVIFRDALRLLRRKIVQVLEKLSALAAEHRALPTLGYTHFQPAQLVTVGKRFCLYMQDLTVDLDDIERLIETTPMRGVKGTTGTQASFLELFDGDHSKVRALDRMVCEKMGFARSVPVSGQTVSRKFDTRMLYSLSGIAQSATKFAVDVRLLQSLKCVEEPFSATQVGSSAMPYKRNPMRCERLCSLARFVTSLPANCEGNHSLQWFERTLDDSANRRLSIPEAFLATDVVLSLWLNICDGMVVWPTVVRKHVMAELPFMATEKILMACVAAGGDRQELHEAIREHSMAAGARVKGDGAENDLLERIRGDARFAAVHAELEQLVDPALFIGRCPEQVDEFIAEVIQPILEAHAEDVARENEDAVTL